jgi:hypothetical protein
MQHTTSTAGRGLAIAAGVVLASGTLAILFEDVLIHAAPFALKHYIVLVVVAGTMMAGHLADQARRARHVVSCLGFALIFIAGTGLVVYSSVGRQAEKTMLSSAEHDDLVQQRLDLKAALTAERETLKARKAEADAECKSGEGTKCRGARATVAFYETSIKGLEARLSLLDPAKPVSPEAEQLGAFAEALGYDKDKVKAVAVLMAPFFITLFLEFGTIVSFGFAFSPKRKIDARWLPTEIETAQTSFAAPEPPSPPQGPKRKPKRLPDNVFPLRHPAIEAIERADHPLTNRELAEAMSVSEGEASKRWQEVAHLLDVGRQGKELRITLKRRA